MRAWFEQLPTEARWVIGATLGGLVILVMTALLKVSASLLDSLQQSGRYEPRIARMLGYEATAQELQVAAQAFSRALDGLAYPGRMMRTRQEPDYNRPFEGSPRRLA